MTTPTNGQAEQPQFMPDAHFAVQAQQEELTRIREIEVNLNDRLIYQRAVMLQLQAESAHRDSLRQGEIEQLRAELEQVRKQLFESRESHKAEAEMTVPADEVDEQLDNQIADGEWTGGEHTPVRIDEHVLPTPETAKFDRGDGEDDSFPEPQAGIPADLDAK
jgi:hypothetical protein